MALAERTLTGVPGLDELLHGGIPRGRIVLVVGGPGTGKTILCTQFLVNGIQKYGENSVLVTLDESKAHIHSEMAKFGWNLAELEKEKKLAFVDASPIRYVTGEVKIGKLTLGKREFSMLSLIEGVQRGVEMVNAKRVVVDPIASFIFQYPDMIQRRTAILDLIEALMNTGATCLLTTELRAGGLERSVQLEEYLAHGVIILQTLQIGKFLSRTLQVEKMRETAIDPQPRPYKITDTGIEVYPKESIF